MKKIKIVIIGYGNVGRGVQKAIAKNQDMELVAIASRSVERVKAEVKDVPVVDVREIAKWQAELQADVAILCGGSKSDLDKQTPEIIKYIPTIDSFDNHSCLPAYYAKIDEAAKKANRPAIISLGWDPGIFSLERVLANAYLVGARAYGFYGLGPKGGLSMGHSDAIRTIKGVKDARQYTHAITEAIDKVRNGENPEFSAGDMHSRECFVVLEDGANPAEIEAQIKSMPGYFAPYKTTVNFVTQEELNEKFKGFPHDGCVVSSSTTGDGNGALIEYRCQWGSNPEATAQVLTAYARALKKFVDEGKCGAFTILDIPASYVSPLSKEDLLAKMM
ncbi:MAG: diaminopimelate dehydrogenase [Lentisphaeria bacterium]|nr:diaminopimelate dehydrogenase [Lentisphaeria bacterium]